MVAPLLSSSRAATSQTTPFVGTVAARATFTAKHSGPFVAVPSIQLYRDIAAGLKVVDFSLPRTKGVCTAEKKTHTLARTHHKKDVDYDEQNSNNVGADVQVATHDELNVDRSP